jgi:hypothetical protein
MSFLIALLLAQAHPCMADAKKLCPEVKPEHGAVLACLKSHKDQVSPACSARLAGFQEEAESCKADVEKLCPGSKPGEERMACMREHKDQISPRCRESFMNMHDPGAAGREAKASCQSDVEKFCGKVTPGEGRIIACLQQHQSDLTPACSAQMKHR